MHADQIRLHAGRRPLVLVNRDVNGISRVLIDSAQGVSAAISHLHDLGHRRIVYVCGPSASWSNQQRQRAIRRETQRRAIDLITIPARLPTYESGRAITNQLLDTAATAAIAFDDIVALGLIAGLTDRGIDVPACFSVIGCDERHGGDHLSAPDHHRGPVFGCRRGGGRFASQSPQGQRPRRGTLRSRLPSCGCEQPRPRLSTGESTFKTSLPLP